MAERVEPLTVTVWVTAQPQLARRTTVPRAQRRQRLAAILPESTDLAFYRDCRPTRERDRAVVLNRNKNALVQQTQHQPDGARGLAEDREKSAWLYLWRNLNYMGDVDYMISKLRGTAGSSVGTGRCDTRI